MYGQITREFLGLQMQNFQGIMFIWIRTYREIFKSALVYLYPDQVLHFLLFDKHEYTYGIFWPVILVSIFICYRFMHVFFLKIWLTESTLIFREYPFRVTWFLLATSQFFSDKSKHPSPEWHILVKRNYAGKLPVSIKCHNLHPFKEGVIFLCQSIIETRQVSYLYDSALLQSL